MTYGALHLSAFALTVMGVVAVSMLGLATLLYIFDMGAAIVVHSLAFILAVVMLATWLTSLTMTDWHSAGPLPVAGALIALVLVAAIPPWLGEEL